MRVQELAFLWGQSLQLATSRPFLNTSSDPKNITSRMAIRLCGNRFI